MRACIASLSLSIRALIAICPALSSFVVLSVSVVNAMPLIDYAV